MLIAFVTETENNPNINRRMDIPMYFIQWNTYNNENEWTSAIGNNVGKSQAKYKDILFSSICMMFKARLN